jgi:hypothetical protein
MTVKKSSDARRKLIEFDGETWNALEILRRDRLATWQDLADEAFADLLKKHGRPVDLRTALRKSARQAPLPASAEPAADWRKSTPRRRRKKASA